MPSAHRLPAAVLGWLLLAATPAPPVTLFDAQGYRIGHYRAPVPAAPAGVRRVDTAAALRLRREGALFVDVAPADGAVRGADGRWRLARSRQSIAGAHWFPGAGTGAPEAAAIEWFLRGIDRLTGEDRRRPVVVFCLADCWLSWNAARRLAAAGYARVAWYGEGTDGWAEAGQPLVPAVPEPD